MNFVICWQPFQTFWTQIRPNKMSGLIWIQAVWHSDICSSKNFMKKSDFEKTCRSKKIMKNYPACKELTQFNSGLLSGCDTGIGHALAKKLDHIGYHVFAGCLYKGSEGEKKLMSECSDQLSTIQLDVTNIKEVQQAVERVQKSLGEKSKHRFR